MDRPKIKDYFPENMTTQMLNNTFLENKELYDYMQALDNYIDQHDNEIKALIDIDDKWLDDYKEKAEATLAFIKDDIPKRNLAKIILRLVKAIKALKEKL